MCKTAQQPGEVNKNNAVAIKDRHCIQKQNRHSHAIALQTGYLLPRNNEGHTREHDKWKYPA